MATPDTRLTAPHSIGTGAFNVLDMTAVIAARGGLPVEVVVAKANGYGTPLQVSGTFTVRSSTAETLVGCDLVTGQDTNFGPGDLVFLAGVTAVTERPISTPADASTINCDVSQFTCFIPNPMGGNRALTLSNLPAVPPYVRPFTVVLTQDSSGSRLVTSWFAGFTVRWAGGSAPTLTPTGNKSDAFVFLQIGATTLLGSIAGQDY